ncbi:ANTAR domain [uncultured Roseburia sp.]|uniref:ANTAR domain-containing protein n=1 Tax=Brotonthovivens ammoniilytica TaxID=2981725 RepID=A0ABT2TLH0_9FIRM|nr:ANTAR domain-containing protein [Brotonthovivens ammoniilytica]MCU6762497.1 ANTAR domain-containing protein [Brotonthovivens ammoniilytica]SCI73862.1 ANTAR domain [uncultured Roseburia sp.]
MTGIIIAFPKSENGQNIKNILTRNGYHVLAVCVSGAQVLQEAYSLRDGIVISGYRLTDMFYTELLNDLPEDFDMLLISAKVQLAEQRNSALLSLSMPMKVHELLSTVEMMVYNREKKKKKRKSAPRKRTGEEKELIEKAKAVLMERNHMTEEDAHRYIQKCSMESGSSLPETSQMIISMIDT